MLIYLVTYGHNWKLSNALARSHLESGISTAKGPAPGPHLLNTWLWKHYLTSLGLLWRLRQYRIHLQFRRPRFNPWVGKISWRSEWLPTPVFLPREFQWQRSLVGCSPWGHRESDRTKQLILLLQDSLGPRFFTSKDRSNNSNNNCWMLLISEYYSKWSQYNSFNPIKSEVTTMNRLQLGNRGTASKW